MSNPADLVATRRCLHGVAELVMAGPQYRRSGTIRLRVVPGGFATVAEPALRTDRTELVAGDRRTPLTGRTYAEIADRAGVDVGAPAGLYHDGSGMDAKDVIELEPAAAGYLADRLELGDRALRGFAPASVPVLWPEHFDLGITVDEVNYGVSLGDATIAEPYAYVGPYQRRSGDFWNYPFGAARPLRELGADDAVVAFFAEGRERAGRDPLAS
jgi:hypothetical protein